MNRQIVADFVVILVVGAIFFVMDKSAKEKWSGRIFFFWEVVTVSIGSGILQLLTGHNPVIEWLVVFVNIFRRHLPTIVTLISLYLVLGLTMTLLARISPRFRRWAENGLFSTDQER